MTPLQRAAAAGDRQAQALLCIIEGRWERPPPDPTDPGQQRAAYLLARLRAQVGTLTAARQGVTTARTMLGLPPLTGAALDAAAWDLLRRVGK